MFLKILELRAKNISKILGKADCVGWSQILDKKALNGPWKTFKKYSKKYQKHKIVYNLWQNPKLILSILSNV